MCEATSWCIRRPPSPVPGPAWWSSRGFSADVVDRASNTSFGIIAAQRTASAAAGDHFAKSDANDRFWNAAQKLALYAPQVRAAYYANDTLAVICQARLSPRISPPHR